jgi:hypothetical protein
MFSPWVYIATTIALTIFYVFLLIATDGSTQHINRVCLLMTFLLCAVVSIMLLTAIGGAIDIAYGK